MSVVAEASVTVAVPPARALARLADFPAWSRFMPASFRPVRGPERPLALGDALFVKLRGLPTDTKLEVVQLEPERLIAWSGGVPGLLHAVHAFHFEPHEGGARVRSVETWTGVLARGPAGALVKRAAERVGREQLEGLANDLRARP